MPGQSIQTLERLKFGEQAIGSSPKRDARKGYVLNYVEFCPNLLMPEEFKSSQSKTAHEEGLLVSRTGGTAATPLFHRLF